MSHRYSSNCISKALEQANDLQGYSRSLKMARIDSPYDTSYERCVVRTCLSQQTCWLPTYLGTTQLHTVLLFGPRVPPLAQNGVHFHVSAPGAENPIVTPIA